MEVSVTYIGHSGFFVEYEDKALLFDYYEGDIPKAQANDIYLFVSHRHYDHYNQNIFSVFSDAKRRTYIVSSDANVPKETADALAKRGEALYRPDAHETFAAGQLTVGTLASNDEGVAYLVEDNGLSLYHGGDLNYWYWYDESEAYNKYLTDTFASEMAHLAGRHIQIAFQAVDPRLDANVFAGAQVLLSTAKVDHLFPMHMWKDERIPGLLAGQDFVEQSGTRVHDPYKGRIRLTL